ncbi:hypothetical protein [Mongoliitalea daihaiensis]|uniref:hypothetical protein n=1 Tax=Mongoliitalea daihaiensis TaxID=2782006 RepID=UPI001F432E65|nr:hypothetical protein [Mongoliitalea daihaiensis]UJP66649.1 hypothetical protein IPZ59_08705 [Mongoliitalea daihaiensis]
MNKLIKLSFLIFLFTGCQVDNRHVNEAYEKSIYAWYSSYYRTIQDFYSESKEEVWVLFFDYEKVCDTCKLEILTQVRERPNVLVLTNFRNEIKSSLFKRTYKLENIVLDGLVNSDDYFPTPFIFLMKDKSMYQLTILEEEALKKGTLKKLLKN